MFKSKKVYNQILFVVIISYVVLFIIMTLNYGFGDFPEETMRFQISKFIFNNGKLPTLFDSSIYDAKYGFSYAGNPCLPYIIQAIFMKVASWCGVQNHCLFIVARFTNVLLGIIFIIVVKLIAENLFNDKRNANLFFIIASLWSYNYYVFTYVNCDGMMLLGCALVILFSVKGIKGEWNLKSCIGLGVGNSIILLSYINGCVYCVFSAIIFVSSFIIQSNKSKKYLVMIRKGLMIVFEVVILSGWFYIRNLLLYGSLLGSNISNELSRGRGISELTVDFRAKKAMDSMFSIKGFGYWIKGQAVNFCGKIVHTESSVLKVLYWLLTIIVIILFILALVYIKNNWYNYSIKQRLLGIGFAIVIVLTIMVDFYYSAFVDYIPEYSRYLVPMSIPLSCFLTYGIKTIMDKNKINPIIVYVGLMVILIGINCILSIGI